MIQNNDKINKNSTQHATAVVRMSSSSMVLIRNINAKFHSF